MQRLRVISIIPTMFEVATVDRASGAPLIRWSSQSYRDILLPWYEHRCDTGSVFSLAQVFVVPGRTRTAGRAPTRICCRKVGTTGYNPADITNLCCKLSTPLSSATLQTI
ncbi:hypothetical protein MRX96_046447 [Rhipicephalus microplus]